MTLFALPLGERLCALLVLRTPRLNQPSEGRAGPPKATGLGGSDEPGGTFVVTLPRLHSRVVSSLPRIPNPELPCLRQRQRRDSSCPGSALGMSPPPHCCWLP